MSGGDKYGRQGHPTNTPPFPPQHPTANFQWVGSTFHARDDLRGAIRKLYEVSRIKGLTPQGWKALEAQIGGLTPGAAAKFLTPMSSISEEKVAYLNAGKSTTGETLG